MINIRTICIYMIILYPICERNSKLSLMKHHKTFAWFSFSTLSYSEWTYLRVRKCGNIIIYHELMDISQIIFDASFIINLIFPNLRFMLIRYSWWILWNNKVLKKILKALNARLVRSFILVFERKWFLTVIYAYHEVDKNEILVW